MQYLPGALSALALLHDDIDVGPATAGPHFEAGACLVHEHAFWPLVAVDFNPNLRAVPVDNLGLGVDGGEPHFFEPFSAVLLLRGKGRKTDETQNERGQDSTLHVLLLRIPTRTHR